MRAFDKSGVVAAGHPATAEAGAQVLRAGGNAADAAVAAVLASFAAESPLTGFGAGGFMLVHQPDGQAHLLDFFVAAPAKVMPAEALVEVEVDFEEARQSFHCGPASAGVYGTAAGLQAAAERFGTMPLGELVRPAAALAKAGVATTPVQAFLYKILEPVLTRWPESRAIYAPDGRMPAEGDVVRIPDLPAALELFGAEGAEPFYRGDIAAEVCRFTQELGGALTMADFDGYRVVDRTPARIEYRGRTVFTNPPPSSGGILIARSLYELATRDDVGVADLVRALGVANAARDQRFAAQLSEEDFFDRFIDEACAPAVAVEDLKSGGLDGDHVGSTTHISVIDSDGMAVSCTCSNGAGSGVLIPGTGVALNNMLGEQDLNFTGLGTATPGSRITSMMAPTVVVKDGIPELVLGSAGSNRIRSAILQTIVNVVDHGMTVHDAVHAPRLHFEDGTVQAEPETGPRQLEAVEQSGIRVNRWARPNLFFGGCQAVGVDPATGTISGAGDPRRGGAVSTG